MKLPVRTTQAKLLGNGLIAHVRTVQAFRKTHGKLPQRPYLTYSQLVDQTGAKLALVGIGNFLGEVMVAIHAPDAPDAMRGLTLFVTPRDGQIDFSKGAEEWYGITPKNAPQFRKAVLDFDWSDVEFVSIAGEG
jgi:hypothetical protein